MKETKVACGSCAYRQLARLAVVIVILLISLSPAVRSAIVR